MAKSLWPEKQRHIEIFWLLRNKTQGIIQALIYITNCAISAHKVSFLPGKSPACYSCLCPSKDMLCTGSSSLTTLRSMALPCLLITSRRFPKGCSFPEFLRISGSAISLGYLRQRKKENFSAGRSWARDGSCKGEWTSLCCLQFPPVHHSRAFWGSSTHVGESQSHVCTWEWVVGKSVSFRLWTLCPCPPPLLQVIIIGMV